MASPLEDSTLEEQRSVNRFLVAEGVKPSEIFRARKMGQMHNCRG